VRRPGRWIGAGLVACIAVVAIAAPLLAPQNTYDSGINMLTLPSTVHWFGTDALGRDVLSRVIYGARASLAIGFGAALVAMLIGVPVGLIAGTLHGAVDVALAAVIDLFIALPGLVLALIITVMVGPSQRNLILVLGFVMWPPIAPLDGVTGGLPG
jgi:peptide/nickel transport system permease protein